MISRTISALFALILAACGASASGAAASVQVANAWARATAPGQNTAVVYMDITSDADAALVAAGSAVAERVELHSMTTEGGVMRMRPLAKVELPARRTVKLAPNGAHLMLVNLKQPLRAGETVPLVLSVQASGMSLTTVNVQAEVRGITGSHGHNP